MKSKLLQSIFVGLAFFAFTVNLFALRVEEQNRSKGKDQIIDREVSATSAVGVKHGFAAYFCQKGGFARPIDKNGFRIGYVPTGNWYLGSFFKNIIVNGKPIKLLKSRYPEVVRVLFNNSEKTVLGTSFDTEAGELRITMLLQKDKYYSYVKFDFVDPVEPVKTLDLSLINHPGHFDKKKLGRVVRKNKKKI